MEQNQTVNKLVANFTTGNYSWVNVTEPVPYTNVTYIVVADITNLSDLEAKMYEASFVAAQNISIVYSALGGESLNRGYTGDPGVGFGGVVDGVWLDGKWLNSTWVRGTDYPLNIQRIMTPDHKTLYTIPTLPENATDEGMWIEGVPIAEHYGSTKMTSTQIYINGFWVDVRGRVQPGSPKPTVLATNTLVDETLFSGDSIYRNVGNASVGPITAMPGWQTYNSNGPTYRWARDSGFSTVWEPHQSKLIAFTGTQTFSNSRGMNSTVASLKNGIISLYGSVTSFVNNTPVNGTYYNAVLTATWINSVPMQKTSNGYVYNAILVHNQTFHISPNGVEASIKQGGD